MLHTDLIAPIPELLRRHARARGAKIAYRDAHAAVTYAELLERTGKLAGHRQRRCRRRDGRDHAAQFCAMGRGLSCDCAGGRIERADQL